MIQLRIPVTAACLMVGLAACQPAPATLETRCDVALTAFEDFHAQSPDQTAFFVEGPESAASSDQIFRVESFQRAEQEGEDPGMALLDAYRRHTPTTAHLQCPAVLHRMDELGFDHGDRTEFYESPVYGPGFETSSELWTPLVLGDRAVVYLAYGNAVLSTETLLLYRRFGDDWRRVGSRESLTYF